MFNPNNGPFKPGKIQKEESSSDILTAATFLPKPNTNKETYLEERESLIVGYSSMQGWRKSMEDVSVVWVRIPADTTDTVFCGVFDGHGGSSVAEYAGTFLLHYIMSQPEWTTDLKEAIRKGYIECDHGLRDEKDPRHALMGSTGITVFIRGNQLYCGNIGDSRAIACEREQVVKLSQDHKPTLISEKDRIVAAGGQVFMDRVNGNLGLSRAFGDFAYKKQKGPPEAQMVTSVPEVITKTVDKSWQFVVLACDGIWEVFDDLNVLKFVRAKLSQNQSPAAACEALLQQCLATSCDVYASGCDNMSVIIVQFKWEK